MKMYSPLLSAVLFSTLLAVSLAQTPDSTADPTTAPPDPPTTRASRSSAPPPPVTAAPVNQDGLGTPCATNLPKAWLDIVLVVDVSKSISERELNNLGYGLATAVSNMTFGQDVTPAHTSRISLITFTDVAQVQWGLNDSQASVIDDLKHFKKYVSTKEGSSSVVAGVKQAYNIHLSQKSFRKQVIILVAATYSNTEMDDAEHIATQLKNDDVTIFVISYSSMQGLNTMDEFKKLASEDYFYQSDSTKYPEKISSGLTQVNCFCPQYTLQLRVKNNKFADCLQGQTAVINPDWVADSCAPGVGIAVESPEKLDFTVSKLVPLFPSPIQEFSTGALFKNGKWVWSGYDNMDKEFGQFPAVSSKDGDYGYFKNDGSKWQFAGGKDGKDNARAYICQTRACDTDHLCDLSIKKKYVF